MKGEPRKVPQIFMISKYFESDQDSGVLLFSTAGCRQIWWSYRDERYRSFFFSGSRQLNEWKRGLPQYAAWITLYRDATEEEVRRFKLGWLMQQL